jgi:outer membrane protein TolC
MLHLQEASDDDLELQVTRSYIAVLTAAEFVRAAEAAVKAFQESERVVASRVASGTALKTSLLEIQVQLARSEEMLLQASNSLALAKESLRSIMGLENFPYTGFEHLDILELEQPSTASEGNRPELLAKTAFIRAARYDLRAAKGGFLPTVNAFVGVERFQGWKFDGNHRTWNTGVLLEWPIFDGFLTASLVKEKRARLNAAEEEERLTKLQVSLEIMAAKLSVNEASERVTVMNRAVKLASENVTLTRQRFDQGLMLTTEVVDAENSLVRAEVGLAEAKGDRLNAIASLRRALNLSIIGGH